MGNFLSQTYSGPIPHTLLRCCHAMLKHGALSNYCGVLKSWPVTVAKLLSTASELVEVLLDMSEPCPVNQITRMLGVGIRHLIA